MSHPAPPTNRVTRTQKVAAKAVKPYQDCIREMLELSFGVHKEALLYVVEKHKIDLG